MAGCLVLAVFGGTKNQSVHLIHRAEVTRSPMGRKGKLIPRDLGVEYDPLSAACAVPSLPALLALTATCIFPSPGSLKPPGCEPELGEKQVGSTLGQSDAHTAGRLSVRAMGMRHRRSEIQPPDS